MGIYRWVGAGLLYCRLLTIIVCETRPYDRSAVVETATTLALRPRNARLKKRRFKTGCDVKKDDRPDSLLHSQPAKHLFGVDIQGNNFGHRNDIASFAGLRC